MVLRFMMLDHLSMVKRVILRGKHHHHLRAIVMLSGTSNLAAAVFSKISQFLEQFLMEHIDIKVSLDSKLQIDSICSIRIRSIN